MMDNQWIFEYDNDTGPDDDYFEEFFTIYDSRRQEIARVHEKSDAALIAAAPDLIDAAEMAFCLLDNFVEDPRVDVEIKATMAELQKAINKAKGE
jgi:hypothetical protein